MCLVLKALTFILAISGSPSLRLPCNFNYERQSGYICRVDNFTNVKRNVYIEQVIGIHHNQSDKNYRDRPLESVVRLVMWNLRVHYLPGNLTEHFPYLINLQVKKCGMKSLTRGEEFHGLRKIYFGFNEIDRIPVNYFWHFCRLEMLSLYGNRISSIPEMAFRDLKSLKRLSLNDNMLKELNPILFDNCKSLEYIDLGNNLLEKIDSNLFANLIKLSRINLRNNTLKSIDNDFLSTLTGLKVLLLQDNKCINDSFNEIQTSKQTPLAYFQHIFRENCSHPIALTTTSPRPSTTKPRKKQIYNRNQKVYYLENCQWKVPKGHRYF